MEGRKMRESRFKMRCKHFWLRNSQGVLVFFIKKQYYPNSCFEKSEENLKVDTILVEGLVGYSQL